jgi:hypothetical protein
LKKIEAEWRGKTWLKYYEKVKIGTILSLRDKRLNRLIIISYEAKIVTKCQRRILKASLSERYSIGVFGVLQCCRFKNNA